VPVIGWLVGVVLLLRASAWSGREKAAGDLGQVAQALDHADLSRLGSRSDGVRSSQRCRGLQPVQGPPMDEV
jgi:hypothetical protein